MFYPTITTGIFVMVFSIFTLVSAPTVSALTPPESRIDDIRHIIRSNINSARSKITEASIQNVTM